MKANKYVYLLSFTQISNITKKPNLYSYNTDILISIDRNYVALKMFKSLLPLLFFYLFESYVINCVCVCVFAHKIFNRKIISRYLLTIKYNYSTYRID